MTDVPFDTMATARLLRESGIGERQAAAVTTAVRDGVTGGVATKADIAEVRADVARLESGLRTDLGWMKLTGGAIPAVPVLAAVLAEPVAATTPGQASARPGPESRRPPRHQAARAGGHGRTPVRRVGEAPRGHGLTSGRGASIYRWSDL